MGSHSTRAYLNSCLKVPIDPCNNCPAPVYNRPRLCMGKQKKKTTVPCAKSADATATATWTGQTGIRSLAKFYDSIPDYCEVKHLHQAEFYSTLESLRITSRELRAQPAPPEPQTQKQRCSSATPSSGSCSQKPKQRRKAKKKPTPLFLTPSIPTPTAPVIPAPVVHNSCLNLSEEYDKCLRDLSRLKSFKHDFAIEVADFKRSLKSFELEFKRNAERPKSSSSHGTQTVEHIPQKPSCKTPAMHTAERAKCRREQLRRSLSVNDLNGSHETPEPATKSVQEPMSSYFVDKEVPVVPQLQIECPSVSSKRSGCSSSVTSGSSRVRRRRARKANVAAAVETQEQPTLLSILELEQLPKHRTPSVVSPQHPVARPNLAATLRAEVARKKVKELKNNCTYHDPRPQFDWEVRKTPAWKSLSFNESHKALLSIRLATRKAEQALQERQYDLHMQMMQQRVKSAPLLLEGPTYWGPEVGKLSHNCRSEGIRHACESSQQRKGKQHKQHKKKCSNSRCPVAATDAEAKLQQIRKIYGCQLKPGSRQSQRSSSRRRATERTPEPHDSADDLCSVDRAFL